MLILPRLVKATSSYNAQTFGTTNNSFTSVWCYSECAARCAKLGGFLGIGETGGRNVPQSDSPLPLESDLLAGQSPGAKSIPLPSGARQCSS